MQTLRKLCALLVRLLTLGRVRLDTREPLQACVMDSYERANLGQFALSEDPWEDDTVDDLDTPLDAWPASVPVIAPDARTFTTPLLKPLDMPQELETDPEVLATWASDLCLDPAPVTRGEERLYAVAVFDGHYWTVAIEAACSAKEAEATVAFLWPYAIEDMDTREAVPINVSSPAQPPLIYMGHPTKGVTFPIPAPGY